MDLADLRAFIKVVQLGGFTRAAEALGVDKARLSRRLARLEAHLGAQLLRRSTRAVTPTAVGRDLYDRGLGILDAVSEAERSVHRERDEPAGRLRLTCGPEFGLLKVTNWIGGFLARYPRVTVEAEFTSRIVDLIEEGFDLAIRIGELEDSSLTARKLGRIDYGVYASPAYLARRGWPRHPRELERDHDLLAFNVGSRPRHWAFSGTEGNIVVRGAGRLAINNSLALREAALAGLGVARLPMMIAADAVRAGALCALLTEWSTPSIDIHGLYAGTRHLSPNVRRFIDYVIEQTAIEANLAP